MQIYGLIGFPVKHSLSPYMHNAAFKACGIDACYRLFQIEPKSLKDFLLKDVRVKDLRGESLSSKDIIGFNITIPHKLNAYKILEEIRPQEKDYYLKLSGAVNTVKRTLQGFKYCNTDASGFVESLKKDLGFDARGKNVFLFGCGGAGRAVAAGLSSLELGLRKIYLYDIRSKASDSLKEHFSGLNLRVELEAVSAQKIGVKIEDSQLLVDASGAGLKKEDISVVDKRLLHKDLSVYDLVYNKDTRLLRQARSLGLKACGGEGMLLYQGVLAFEFWTGQKAPLEAMRGALQEALGKC